MNSLSDLLNPTSIQKLKDQIDRGAFPHLSFENAMGFILNNGLMPENNLSVRSLLQLETWFRSESRSGSLDYSATELKNKTGEILERVLQGHIVTLRKHGRAIAEIHPIHRLTQD